MKIIRKHLSKTKRDAVQDWKVKERRFIIYKLWNVLNKYVSKNIWRLIKILNLFDVSPKHQMLKF